MSDYEKVVEAIQSEGLSWSDVDRILLNEETHMDFYKRADESMNLSNYATTDSPAVRVTSGQEKIIYVDEDGYEVEVIV